jgi:hypothetical protein
MESTAEFGIIYCPFGYDNPERKQWSIIRFEETPKAVKMHTVGEYFTRQDAEQAARNLHLDVA